MDLGSHSPGGRERSDSAFGSCCWSLAFAKCGVTGFYFFFSSPPPALSLSFHPGWAAALCTLQRRGMHSRWGKECLVDRPGCLFWARSLRGEPDHPCQPLFSVSVVLSAPPYPEEITFLCNWSHSHDRCWQWFLPGTSAREQSGSAAERGAARWCPSCIPLLPRSASSPPPSSWPGRAVVLHSPESLGWLRAST